VISNVKRITGLAMSCFLGLSSAAVAGGKGSSSFVDCKKDPTPTTILEAMLKKWPVDGADFEKLTPAQKYLEIENYGYQQQNAIDGIDGAKDPGKSLLPPPATAPLLLDRLDWKSRNNLGLMYHQFVDGTIVSDIDKVGYVEWKDARSARSAISGRGFYLLHDWTISVARDQTTQFVCVGKEPADTTPKAPERKNPSTTTSVAAAPLNNPAATSGFKPDKDQLPAATPAAPASGGGIALADARPKPDWKPTKPPSWTALVYPRVAEINGYAPKFYMRGSPALLSQGLGDTIFNSVNSEAATLPKTGGSENSASIAFHHDQLDHTSNTFTMHVAIGFGFSPADDGKSRSGSPDGYGYHDGWLLPYISADRVNKADPKALKNNLTDIAAGAGFVGVWKLNTDAKEGKVAVQATNASWWEPSEIRIATRIQADTDDKFGASILYWTAQLSATPQFFDCMTKSFPYSDSYIQLACNYNLDVDYGHIFNAGDFINLNQKEYARVGFDVSGTIYGLDPSDQDAGAPPSWRSILIGLASRLSYTASYKTLHDFSGTHADLTRFDTSLNFKLSSDTGSGGGAGGGSGGGSGSDNSQSTSIALTYTNGKADVSLTPQRYWELAFKAAF